ncbi:hypothetical protein Patl1_30532 [Pistacia atlantica]|uniref:Uncharacterized protein n=1 Tax=Pistacia atlantica TaxID=434234 RepID=A0ACC1A8R7_9ROSI|nr:hypothetical protein Patl1_30532 [Pistacia atlantica]
MIAFMLLFHVGSVLSHFPTTLTLERAIPPSHQLQLAQLIARDRKRHGRLLYYTKVQLGSPPREFNVQIDTGSDVLWVSCSSCNGCPGTSGLQIQLNFFDPQSSSTASLVSCSDPRCSLGLTSADSVCSSQKNQCGYTFQYGDGSGTSGYYVADLLHLDTIVQGSVNTNSSSQIVFGCSTLQTGDLTKSDRAVDGIFGFGQQGMSVISQLASSGLTPRVFSHCLKGDSAGGGILVLGEIVEPNIVYSPLVPITLVLFFSQSCDALRQSYFTELFSSLPLYYKFIVHLGIFYSVKRPHYNLNLQSISVNGQPLDVNPSVFATSSNKGTIVDTGTTLAYLTADAYDPLVNAITSSVLQPVRSILSKGNQCFIVTTSIAGIFPQVSFNFAGGASLVLNPQDYLIQQNSVGGAAVWCIGFQKIQGQTILGGIDSTKIILAITGQLSISLVDLVLKDKIVVYDLAGQRIGWANYDCSMSVNVSTATNTGRSEYVNAGQLSGDTAPRPQPHKLIQMNMIAFLLHILMLGRMSDQPITSTATLFSLYVGDLDPSVTEEKLIETFSSIPEFHTAVLCKDALKKLSLCYGYINYNTLESATEAINTFNHKVVNGKSMRVMRSMPNSDVRNSGIGNLFVKNLASSINNLKLHEIFIEHGTILSCKVAVSEAGDSKGYGFVQYAEEESAKNAIEKVNGVTIEGKELYVAHLVRRNDRDTSFTNLYVKNLEDDISEEVLAEKFSEFGKITSLVISKDVNGVSRGFGFVNFEIAEDAMRAKECMHGKQIGSKVLYVARAQKKVERRQILRLQFKERSRKGLNLYCKNIHDDVDDMQLEAYFSHYGTITSTKIMRTDKGISRGFGFISFSNLEESSKAINTLHGTMFHGKPLYVTKAQSREERRKYLQQVYARQRMLGPPPIPSFIGFNNQLYHSRPLLPPLPPIQIYQPQPPNFTKWRSTNGFAPLKGHNQPPLPPLPMVPSSIRRINMNRNDGNYPSLPFMHNNLSGPSQRNPHLIKMITNGSRLSEDISSLLVAASPNQRKGILGQRLLQLMKKIKNDIFVKDSSKIIEMLLEMDNSELLVLLESPNY